MDDVHLLADREEWAVCQFGTAELGDRRRTRRLVKVAAQAAGNSCGSIPQQAGRWADAKAAYRLFDTEEVTHAAVCQPHFDWTRQRAGELPMVFLVQDVMTAAFTSHHACRGLGPVGTQDGPTGLHQMNVLAVDSVRRQPMGLMYQRHYVRPPEPLDTRRHIRRKIPSQQRESHWWVEAIRTIGSPPPEVRWVHVGDRGEDMFVAYHQARTQRTDWLIRVARDRSVLTPEGPDRLFDYVRRLPTRMHKTIVTRRPKAEAPEHVPLNIAVGEVILKPSRYEPEQREFDPIPCRLVRVWETSPPPGHDAMEWILCTSLPCQTDTMLGLVADGYGCRWMIEEFHKCEKTGCQIEQRRLESRDRLEPLIGMLSVLPVRLLALKLVARDDPEAPAGTMFDDLMIDVMAKHLNRTAPTKGPADTTRYTAATLTVGQFWRGIGLLGGHLGRKGDGPIGWLRAWRGWQSFHLMILGAHLTSPHETKKYG